MRYQELLEGNEHHNERELLSVRDKVISIIKPNKKDLYGFCGIISVGIWDEMHKPSNLVPFSVFYGEEEHVILYDRTIDWAFDPTAEQFGAKSYFLQNASEHFSKFKKLTQKELESIRKEGVEHLNVPKKETNKNDWFYGFIR